MAALLLSGLPAQRMQGWYSNSASTGETILIQAFEKGKQTFKTAQIGGEYKDKSWFSRQTCIQDIVQTVRNTRDSYQNKRSSKAWKWLTQFSTKINHYSSILDVMVQHHPEYAALAWGAMKLLFVGVQNHEESVHQLAKALDRFADYLPRHELKLILYPSAHMQEAVAKLYALLMEFMAHALHWYQKGTARRAVGAILKPFALDFEDELSRVNEISKSIDKIANTAAQVELREVKTEVENANHELSLVRKEVSRLSDLVIDQADQLLQAASRNQSLSLQLQLDLHTQNSMIKTVQFNQVMSAPFLADIPSSGESLNYCFTFTRRHARAVTLVQTEIEVLRRCSLDNDVSYIIIETRSPNDSKALLLSLLQQVQTAQRPVIWALRFPDYRSRPPCLEDIVRTLALHALEINSDTLISTAFPISLPSLRAASSLSDWLSILNRALAGLEEVYIVIDPDLLCFVAEDNSCSAADLLLALKDSITSSRLKIIVSSIGINKGYFTRNSQAGSWKVVQSNSAQFQRLAKMKKQHLARVRRIRK